MESRVLNRTPGKLIKRLSLSDNRKIHTFGDVLFVTSKYSDLNDFLHRYCCTTGRALGAFEIEPFGRGTFALAAEAARMTKAGKLVSVAGGGDTVAALNAAHVTGDFTYVSTAGGAFLEWLEGRELPGVAALLKAGR